MTRGSRLLALFLLVCASASWAGNGDINLKIVFVDFYDDNVTVHVNGRVLWAGALTVKRENESTGLSLVKEVTLPKCSVIDVHSRNFVDSERICITDRTKLIYISATVEPHIFTSEKDLIELD